MGARLLARACKAATVAVVTLLLLASLAACSFSTPVGAGVAPPKQDPAAPGVVESLDDSLTESVVETVTRPVPAPAAKSKPSPKPRVKLRAAAVTRVVDGDTAWVTLKDSGAPEKVRFIGVDTPESTIEVEPYGAQASAYAKKHLSSKNVYLEMDAENRDRYGRLLAYVWMSKPVVGDRDGRPTFAEARKRMFNAWLARDGFAQTLTIPPNVKYEDYLVRLQRSARENDRGLWNPKILSESSVPRPEKGRFVGNRNSMKFHVGTCRWVSAMSESNKVRFSSRKAAINAGYTPCKVCRP